MLEAALRSKRRPCMIGTGVMSDPYTPLEDRLRMTRQALELIEKYGFGATVLTKSTRILRDLDIFQRINHRSKAVIQMSLTCWDDGLSRQIEPNVSTTRERVAALKTFQAAGIPTVVWLCPILPFITDTPENIRSILEACADAGVKGIIQYGMGLTLREGNREYFYAQLDRKFPGLKQRYIRDYGISYELPSPREGELMGMFNDFCDQYGIWHDNDKIFRYLGEFEEKASQMSFFDL